jgi:general secretion pathway protein K
MLTQPRPRTQQRGIALMTVLLILAIATVVLVSMSSSRQLDIRRTENLIRATQTWEYLFSLETWASEVLQHDIHTNKVDSFDDSWTKPLPETRVQGGKIQADITDLQGRFNLNNLLVDGQPSDPDIQRFQRLLVFLDINPDITNTLLDWIDKDMDIRLPNGAEDETYMRQTPPYRSANRFFADVSELLLIQGMTRKDYEKLKPYVYAANAYAPLNINTAKPLLIRCLAKDLSDYQTELLIRARNKHPFETTNDFLKHDALAGLGLAADSLSTTSNYFLLSGTIQVGKILLQFDSYLTREDNGKIAVVKRQRRSPSP